MLVQKNKRFTIDIFDDYDKIFKYLETIAQFLTYKHDVTAWL